MSAAPSQLPYRLACLCDLRDKYDRVLLLKRLKAPNQGLCSPIGGKLDVISGESPALCAQREILEEAGLHIELADLHMQGVISERSYEGKGHWLLFYFRVTKPVWVEPTDMNEGRLDWYTHAQIDALPLPDTDRKIIWPIVRKTQGSPATGHKPGFFSVHIDCRQNELTWNFEQVMLPE